MKTTWPKLPKAFKKKWVAALMSGKYKQGQCALRYKKQYCCLGVACAVGGKRPDGNCCGYILKTSLKKVTPSIIHGNQDNALVKKLTYFNDHWKWSFNRIATWIEKNL